MPGAYGPLLDELKPGRTVYMQGTTGEPLGLHPALLAEPDRARDVRFFGCFVPGMNEFAYTDLHPTARAATFLLPRALHAGFAEGRVEVFPRSYTGAAEVLAATDFDVAVVQVAPPGADGLCSLGICSDFAPLAWGRARRRVVIVNTAMPAMPRGPRLALAQAEVVIEAEGPLVTLAPSEAGEEAQAIARRVAELIPDHAHFQTGIGGAPGALWGWLKGHKGLRLRSGMANDGLRDLAEAGALAEDGHLVGIALGSLDFYDYLARTDLAAFGSTPQTHDSRVLGALDRFHAVNGALEVDLFGQVNAEWQGRRMGSGIGGAADFTRAAVMSPGGRSIIALPATAKKGALSRIVPQVTAPTVGMARTEIDTVVTEHGVAEVRRLSMDARAEALIAIAAPPFREGLARAWREARRGF